MFGLPGGTIAGRRLLRLWSGFRRSSGLRRGLRCRHAFTMYWLSISRAPCMWAGCTRGQKQDRQQNGIPHATFPAEEICLHDAAPRFSFCSMWFPLSIDAGLPDSFVRRCASLVPNRDYQQSESRRISGVGPGTTCPADCRRHERLIIEPCDGVGSYPIALKQRKRIFLGVPAHYATMGRRGAVEQVL